MLQYSTLIGIVREHKQYVTRAITFCINTTENGVYYFTRSDSGKVHSYFSKDELDYKHRFLIDKGYTEAPYVSAEPLC